MVSFMTTNLLHQLWKLVENSHSFILGLDDSSLIEWLTQQLSQRQALTYEVESEAKAYIQSKLLLIRDLA